MSITQIDFGTTKELTAAVRSLYDPDKQLPQGSALTFMRLVQTDNDASTLTAYLNGDAWFERSVSSQGIIGTTYLFDADDLLTRVNEKLDVWKQNGLRITQTSSNQMKVDCILPNSKRLKLTNNVLISTFNGDEAEFEDRELKVQEYKYETLAEIQQELVLDLFHAIALCDCFSTLKADTTEKEAWLWCRNRELYLTATERDGSQGHGLICVLVGSIESNDDWDIGLRGRHITRITFVSKPIYSDEEVGRGIELRYSEEGKRFHIVGQQGHANIPTVEPYKCRALSQGAAAHFFKEGRGLQVEEKAYRVFDLQELINGVQICTPKKNATRKDIVVEFLEGKAVLYKRSDNKKSERAEVIPASTEGLDEDWMPIVVDHSYLTDALKALKTYIARQQKLEGGFVSESFDIEEQIEEEEIANKMLVKLTQAFNVKVAGHHLLYLQPLNREGCRVVLMVQTKERTEDHNEAD